MFLSHSKKRKKEKGDNELQGIESGHLFYSNHIIPVCSYLRAKNWSFGFTYCILNSKYCIFKPLGFVVNVKIQQLNVISDEKLARMG